MKLYTNFTGHICYRGYVDGYVENATYEVGRITLKTNTDFQENFIFYKGIWKSGTWYNGIWERGIWEDGTWVKGEIHSPYNWNVKDIPNFNQRIDDGVTSPKNAFKTIFTDFYMGKQFFNQIESDIDRILGRGEDPLNFLSYEKENLYKCAVTAHVLEDKLLFSMVDEIYEKIEKILNDLHLQLLKMDLPVGQRFFRIASEEWKYP